MINILFVCHGNICRSPLAEFLMRDLITKRGLADSFYIASAATSTEEIGNHVYPPVRRILEKRGIDCGSKTARRVTATDYEKFDYLICMDSANVRNLTAIVGRDSENKIKKLLDFTDLPRDVADPWYSGDFSTAERDIELGCEALLKYIAKEA